MKRSVARAGVRTFVYRGGVRIADTTLACDGGGGINELVFLSHAPHEQSRARTPRGRSGRQQVLLTEATLDLLGRAGEALRRRALVAAYGRPFVLGDLRLELFPSGHAPGAASLLCEVAGRPVVYAGPVRLGSPPFGATAVQVRRADAVCVDATFAGPSYVFPPLDESRAQVLTFVTETLARSRSPVVLVPPHGGALDVAQILGDQGLVVRAHRSIVQAATLHRDVLPSARPVPLRFAGKLADREVLLWPPDAWPARLAGALPQPVVMLAAPGAHDPEARARTQAEAWVAWSTQADGHELLAYIETTGAREVAAVGTGAANLVEILRASGRTAYVVAPPKQLGLAGMG